jgi:phosphatidylserine/phosphatidylglycerophosphate/cardiolipin synthase-like enzyme
MVRTAVTAAPWQVSSRRNVGLFWVGLLLLSVEPSGAAPLFPAQVAVYFSPHGGATEGVVQELAAAKPQVLAQAYAFTSAPIAQALVDAHKRGVEVLVVLDKSNQTDR